MFLLYAVAQRFIRSRESLHCLALSQSFHERTRNHAGGGGAGVMAEPLAGRPKSQVSGRNEMYLE